MAKKRKKTAKKVKVLKVEKLHPDKHVLHLEIEGPVEVPEVIPAEPLDLEAKYEEAAPESMWTRWLKSLW
jgi:hypothetical protein